MAEPIITSKFNAQGKPVNIPKKKRIIDQQYDLSNVPNSADTETYDFTPPKDVNDWTYQPGKKGDEGEAGAGWFKAPKKFESEYDLTNVNESGSEEQKNQGRVLAGAAGIAKTAPVVASPLFQNAVTNGIGNVATNVASPMFHGANAALAVVGNTVGDIYKDYKDGTGTIGAGRLKMEAGIEDNDPELKKEAVDDLAVGTGHALADNATLGKYPELLADYAIKPTLNAIGSALFTVGKKAGAITNAVTESDLGQVLAPILAGAGNIAKGLIGQTAYGVPLDIAGRQIGMPVYNEANPNYTNKIATSNFGAAQARQDAPNTAALGNYLSDEDKLNHIKGQDAAKASDPWNFMPDSAIKNDLQKKQAVRVQMAEMANQQKGYVDEMSDAVVRGKNLTYVDENGKIKHKPGYDSAKRDFDYATNNLRSLQGQYSAFISMATGQGAMSENDKDTLDRANAEVRTQTNDSAGAAGFQNATGGTGFLRIRQALDNSLQSQWNFLKSTESPFKMAATNFGLDKNTYDLISGNKQIRENYQKIAPFILEGGMTGQQRQLDSREIAYMDTMIIAADDLQLQDLLKGAERSGTLEAYMLKASSGASNRLKDLVAKGFNINSKITPQTGVFAEGGGGGTVTPPPNRDAAPPRSRVRVR